MIHRLMLIIFSLIGCLAATPTKSQTEASIKVLTKVENNHVWLRWAPSDPYLWQLGNRYGYLIERFTLLPNGRPLDSLPTLLTSQALVPYSLEKLESLANQEDRMGVLAEAIYGEEGRVGGDLSNVQAILQNRQDMDNRFGFALLVCDLSWEVAQAAALLWVDSLAQSDQRYIYRINLSQNPSGTEFTPGVVVVDMNEKQTLPPPQDLQAQFEDQSVTLNWPIFLHQGIYTAYIVEKAKVGQAFQPIGEQPYLPASQNKAIDYAFFKDSLPDNTTEYAYRVRGITPFGKVGPPSEAVQGQGHADLSGLLRIDKAEVLNNEEVRLSWQFLPAFQAEIQGYVVERADRADGPYQAIHEGVLSVQPMKYQDRPTQTQNYYQVLALDKSGKERARSFPCLVQLEDNQAPGSVLGLTGRIDSLGIVRLQWQPNPESDLQGYRVFRANDPKEEFIEVSQQIITNSYFQDTVSLRTLSRAVYYTLTAVDQNYNNSDFAPFLRLTRPDTLSPVAPVFMRTRQSGDTISVTWINSSSDDVAYSELYRRDLADSTRWKNLIPGHQLSLRQLIRIKI
ncbi:MAG: hypothetical protein HC880_07190 [Bacteroidia bacterium]|nr:hypothetical protein [Bacteroidia bacterium]